jgi:hypothetical protein
MKQYNQNKKEVRTSFYSNSELEQLVNTAWNFACTALWNDFAFSNKEAESAKRQIRLFFEPSGNLKKAYTVFCQRVLLAHQYLSNASNRFIPLPSVWLNPENEKGFAGTQQWYQKVYDARQSLPNYKIELKALAEAVFEVSIEPTQNNFHYWKNYFIERKTPGLLSLFLNTIANQQFQNTNCNE